MIDGVTKRASKSTMTGVEVERQRSADADGRAARKCKVGAGFTGGDLVAVSAICVLVALGCFYRFGPKWLSADASILTVMSLQRNTLFFWGENRFLNIVPLLASPIRGATANLLVQSALFGGGFVGLLAILGQVYARAVFGSLARVDAWLCFSALLFTFLAVCSVEAIHIYLVYGQPYGLSGLLGGLGLWGLLAAGARRWEVLGLSVAALLVAGGLNPSLLVVAVGIGVVVARRDREQRSRLARAVPLACACCGVWLVASAFLTGPATYVGMAAQPAWWNMGAALSRLLFAFDPDPIARL